MLFFKILQQFLVPSVFIFLLVLFGLILILKRKKLGKIFIVIGLALYYIFSISPTADLILKPLENKYQPIKISELGKADLSPTFGEKVGDKIVLLLGEGEANVLRASEVLRLYNQKLALYRNEVSGPGSKIIITGASIFSPEKNPAKELKDYLVERGIPLENIILEDKSRNTFESAKNLKEIVGEEPFFLVTSAYHLSRSMEVFQKMGTKPIPAPTDFKHTKSARSAEASRNANAPTRIELGYNILDYFPDGQNLRNSDLAFHEYFGILFYRLRYY